MIGLWKSTTSAGHATFDPPTMRMELEPSKLLVSSKPDILRCISSLGSNAPQHAAHHFHHLVRERLGKRPSASRKMKACPDLPGRLTCDSGALALMRISFRRLLGPAAAAEI